MNITAFLYRESKLLLLLTTLAGMINGVSGAALAVVISRAVAGTGKVDTLAMLFFGCCLLQLCTKSFSEVLMLRLTQNAIYKTRVEISKKLLSTPYRKLQKIGKSGLLTILTRDVDIFVNGLQYFPVAFGNLIVLTTCLAYVGWLSWQLFLLFAVIFACGMLMFHLAERRPIRKLVVIREHLEKVYNNFRGLVEGSKELQLNAQRGERFVETVVAPAARAAQKSYVSGISGYIWVLNVGNIMFYVVIGVLLFLIPMWLPQRAEVLSSVTLILLFLVRPVSDLMQVLPTVRQGSIALGRISQLDSKLDMDSPLLLDATLRPERAQAMIELKGVEYLHSVPNEDEFRLGPIDLTVNAGEILFLIGGNGSGKTTLAMLLVGLYQPERGQVLMNGKPVTEADGAAYRANFSAVFSDFYLFDELLTEQHAELPAQAAHYIKLLGMESKVKVIDGKFSTTELSTGQRKRLALVVAYLEERPIYLFDEWASDQDPIFKNVFYTELLPELKRRGKTVIIVSHDDRYFECADRIVKLEHGKVRTEIDNRQVSEAAPVDAQLA
jgi:putative pyoverdin transport system ATP-binding/permease protein